MAGVWFFSFERLLSSLEWYVSSPTASSSTQTEEQMATKFNMSHWRRVSWCSIIIIISFHLLQHLKSNTVLGMTLQWYFLLECFPLPFDDFETTLFYVKMTDCKAHLSILPKWVTALAKVLLLPTLLCVAHTGFHDDHRHDHHRHDSDDDQRRGSSEEGIAH